MKKKLAILAGSLTLTLGGLVMVLSARPVRPEAAKEEAPPKAANSKIVAVTVYPNSALVTRDVDVPAGTGVVELVITPLPQHTINSSLYSESSDGIRVLSTRFRIRPVREDTREEVRKLEEEIKTLQRKAASMQADVKALEQNMLLLTKLEGYTAASTNSATEKGRLDSKETIELAKYLMEGRTQRVTEVVKLQQEIQNNAEQLEFSSRKLREMTAGTSKTERDAVIVVDKTNNGAGKVRLNYLVDAATWHPAYKLRSGKNLKDAAQLEYLAAITQQTGEDWSTVELTLSTAQPMLNAAPPDLKALAVNVVSKGTDLSGLAPMPVPPPPGNRAFNQPQQVQGVGQIGQIGQLGQIGQIGGQFANPYGRANAKDLQEAVQQLKKQAQDESNGRNTMTANDLFNYAGNLDQARDLTLDAHDVVKALTKTSRGPKNEGPSVSFHLASKLTVPSRNDEQVIEVARVELMPDYYYKAVPVLTPHVYKQANMTNRSQFVLLPGEATMYNDKDFVGRMSMPLVAIGESFTVGFGAEPQVQVQRQMTDKKRDMKGGNQILTYEYRILVNSFKPERVKLQVWDRLPQAENETLNVTIGKATPDLSKDAMYLREERTQNLLRWDIELDPDMNGEKAVMIGYDFKLELAKDMIFGTFQSK
jgi:hypothetical protein